MKRGDLVLTSDNYLGIIINDPVGHVDALVFTGNGLTSEYPSRWLTPTSFRSDKAATMRASYEAPANFAEILKD